MICIQQPHLSSTDLTANMRVMLVSLIHTLEQIYITTNGKQYRPRLDLGVIWLQHIDINNSYYVTYVSEISQYIYEHRDNYLWRVPKTIQTMLNDNSQLCTTCIKIYSSVRSFLMGDIAYHTIIILLNHMRRDDKSYIVF